MLPTRIGLVNDLVDHPNLCIDMTHDFRFQSGSYHADDVVVHEVGAGRVLKMPPKKKQKVFTAARAQLATELFNAFDADGD